MCWSDRRRGYFREVLLTSVHITRHHITSIFQAVPPMNEVIRP